MIPSAQAWGHAASFRVRCGGNCGVRKKNHRGIWSENTMKLYYLGLSESSYGSSKSHPLYFPSANLLYSEADGEPIACLVTSGKSKFNGGPNIQFLK